MIELILSPALFPYREAKEHGTVVVDVLRATTSICAAFQAGAAEIVPLTTLEALEDYRATHTLAAERNGEKVKGATCGNSPTEYLTMRLDGARLAYSTTNGTVGLLVADKESRRTWAGCFANLGALAQRLEKEPGDLVILCSGWKKSVSIEDTLFAGALIEQLGRNRAVENDAAYMAMELYQSVTRGATNEQEKAERLYDYCQRGTHIQRLQRLNYDHDIRFAFKADTCPVVPVMKEGRLVTDTTDE